MKIIEVDEELYQYIACQTQSIGESASDILRRLLNLPSMALAFQSLESVKQSETADKKSNGFSEQQSSSASKNTTVVKSVVEQETKETKPEPVKVEQNVSQISQQLHNLLNSTQFNNESKTVVRFLAILSVLYQANTQAFAKAIEQDEVQGRTRTYFARDEQTLLATGNHTKPKPIPNSPYWVITNNNSGRKMLMLERTMQAMALPNELISQIRPYIK
ncbi:MAG: replication initiation negative regulator SeqA [Pasteurellaceae bacterium]|nr:replication initiation negative regulator SeqA [Pasteurellaceae bacterium]